MGSFFISLMILLRFSQIGVMLLMSKLGRLMMAR
jgi:hypothetical protein